MKILKKFSAIILSMIIALSCFGTGGITAFAKTHTIIIIGTSDDNLTWTLDDAGTLTISGTGAMTDYTNDNYAPWYSSWELINTVEIKDGVTSIGWMAFYGCKGLTSITISDSVTSIGYGAFAYCTGLTSITIPNSVKKIGINAFYGCTGLTDITIPAGVTNIGDYAFYDCDNLKYVFYAGTEEQWKAITIGTDNGVFDTASFHWQASDHDYSILVSETEPTCTSEGVIRYKCSACDCTISKVTSQALGHNWDAIYEPTCTTEGVRICSRCGIYVSIAAIGHCYGEPVVKDGVEVRTCKNCKSVIQHSTGSDTDITVTYDNGTFSSDNVSLSVEKHEDPGSVDNHDFIVKIGKTAIVSYDIHMKNGEQPKDGKKVIVSIPVPEGITDYSSLYIFHYKDESYYEKIRCFGSEGDENKFTVENIAGHDYLIFEVSSFSEFAICLETSVSDAVINIASAKTVEYKSKVSTITATASNVPEGYHLAMYVNGSKVADGDNTSVTYNMNKQITSDISYTVKVVDASGTVQKDADGNDLTKEGKITCNASFFAKIIAFFKGIFGLLPTTEVKPD